MHAIPAMIPAGTERQAMDWSLVLVSQGIEALVERDPESGVWRLVVEGPDYQRALGAIRQYHAENRQRRWQQTLPWTGLVFDWRCMVPILIFIVLFALEAAGRADFSRLGMMNNTLVHQGQWWRLFTSVTLHGDMAHLAANVTTGLILIGLAMGVYGAGLGLLVSFLAGVGGNLAGLWLHTAAHRGLGASGMIMGALGLLAAQWLVLLKHGLTARQLAVRGIVSGGFLLILLGFSPQENVDVLAHVAGFVTGLVLGGALAFLPANWRSNAWLDRVALLLVFGGGSVAWWFALRG